MSFRSRQSPPSPWLRVIPFAIAIAGLAVWELLARQGKVSTLFFPAPSIIASTILGLSEGGRLAADIAGSVTRLLAGFLLGGSVGFVLGMIMGTSRTARHILDPFVAAAHPVPKISTLPLIMLIFGIGIFSRTLVVGIAAFFPMLINTMAGVRQINPVYFEVAENYGASRRKVFTRVVMPGSLPLILAGARLALNRSLSITIAVELLMGENGLGSLLWYSWETLRVEELYATIVVIAALGIGFRWVLQRLSERMTPWQVERTA
jgi:ABC-type nitrate/sulfonate/bicarbonate transport system permease component